MKNGFKYAIGMVIGTAVGKLILSFIRSGFIVAFRHYINDETRMAKLKDKDYDWYKTLMRFRQHVN